MLRKIGQLAGVSLKFFFDLDYAFCHHALLMTLLAAGILKIFFTKIIGAFSDGWLTVKSDFMTLKMDIAAFREHWENSGTREALINRLRGLKDNFTQKRLAGGDMD